LKATLYIFITTFAGCNKNNNSRCPGASYVVNNKYQSEDNRN